MKIISSNICTALDPHPVGSKVLHPYEFGSALSRAIEAHDFSQDRIPGQGVLDLSEALPYVSAGEGLRTGDPADYVAVLHRGKVGLYLKREHAAECISCSAVVYTLEAYLADPDLKDEPEEAARVVEKRGGVATHVLVAVLASAVKDPPLTAGRFVANLAGGNREALVWSADEIRDKAKAISEHGMKWCPVAG